MHDAQEDDDIMHIISGYANEDEDEDDDIMTVVSGTVPSTPINRLAVSCASVESNNPSGTKSRKKRMESIGDADLKLASMHTQPCIILIELLGTGHEL
jgi:hypothetical protein